MKKVLAVCVMTMFVATSAFAFSSASAPYGVGAKHAAMGGAGAATVDDIFSAYYNPAGMAKSQAVALKLAGGGASDGLSDLLTAFGNSGDPSKFITGGSSNVSGSLAGMMGLNFSKMGLSIIPIVSNLTVAKTSVGGVSAGSVLMSGGVEVPFSIGYGVGLPFIGGANVGANIKAVNLFNSSGTVTVAGGTQTKVNTNTTYTGVAFDLGMQANLDAIPMMPLSVGIVMKDLGANLNGKTETSTQVGSLAPSITSTDLGSVAMPTTLVIGAAGTIPVVGVKAAIDIDSVSGSGTSYSVTHIGVEYPLFAGLIAGRAGIVTGGPSGSPINMTTLGAGLFGSMLNVAMVSDSNNSKNNQIMFDFGIGF